MVLSGLVRCCLICIVILPCGCGAGDSSEGLQYRQRFLLRKEPQGAISIEQARQGISQNESITLSVRVGSKDIPEWWTENKATMIVSEGLQGSHYDLASGHDPESCPFCRRKWKVEDASAFVEFKDRQGNIIPLDCRVLFDLKENDRLLISGKGHLNEEGFLELTADGIFINST